MELLSTKSRLRTRHSAALAAEERRIGCVNVGAGNLKTVDVCVDQ